MAATNAYGSCKRLWQLQMLTAAETTYSGYKRLQQKKNACQGRRDDTRTVRSSQLATAHKTNAPNC